MTNVVFMYCTHGLIKNKKSAPAFPDPEMNPHSVRRLREGRIPAKTQRRQTNIQGGRLAEVGWKEMESCVSRVPNFSFAK